MKMEFFAWQYQDTHLTINRTKYPIETLRKINVSNIFVNGSEKQRSYFLGGKPSYAATYLGNQEVKLAMLFGKFHEIINIRLDGFNSALHAWNGVALSLQAYPLPHDGTKILIGFSGGSTTMHALQIAPKDKNLVGCKFLDEMR